MAMIGLAGGSARAEGDSTPWWKEAWKSRKKIRIVDGLILGGSDQSSAMKEPEQSNRVSRPEQEEPDENSSSSETGKESDLPWPTMNTARLRFYGEDKTRLDGGDIRIVASGKPVPVNVRSRDPHGYHLVEFKLRPLMNDYFIYFNNPTAVREKNTELWSPRRASVQRTTARSGKGFPSSYDRAIRAFKQANTVYQPEGLTEINHKNWQGRFNLFKSAYYISIYEGFFRAYESGLYDFTVTASSSVFLLINSKMVASTRTRRFSMKGRGLEARGKLDLPRGIHSFRLLHVHYRKRLDLKFAWRPPGRSRFTPIPPSSFVRNIYAEEVTYENRDETPGAFFSVSEPDSMIQMDNGSVVLARFHALSPNTSNSQTYEWKFGDGRLSQKKDPAIFVRLREPYKVTLQVKDGKKVVGQYSRTVVFSNIQGGENLNLTISLVSCPSIVFTGEKNNLAFRVRNEMSSPVMVSYRVTMSEDGKSKAHDGTVEVSTREHAAVLIPVDFGDFSGGRGQISLVMSLLEQKILQLQVRVLRWNDGLRLIRNREGNLVDSSGQRIILVTDLEDQNAYRKWAPIKWLARKADISPKKILLLGDPMKPHSDDSSGFKNYIDVLKGTLGKEAAGFEFHTSSPGIKPIFDNMLTLPSLLAKHQPEIVVLCPGLLDVTNSTPTRDFARALDVMIDLVRGQPTPGRVVLVSPPPWTSHPERSRLYRDSMLKVAKEHHCNFVDLHNYFSSGDRVLRKYFSSRQNPSIFYIYPNASGQNQIAKLIEGGLN